MMLLILEIIFLKIEQTMQLLSLSSFIFFISFNVPLGIVNKTLKQDDG